MSRLAVFFIVIILSTLITIAYLLWGLLIAVPAAEMDDENPYRDRRIVYIIRAVIMFSGSRPIVHWSRLFYI